MSQEYRDERTEYVLCVNGRKVRSNSDLYPIEVEYNWLVHNGAENYTVEKRTTVTVETITDERILP